MGVPNAAESDGWRRLVRNAEGQECDKLKKRLATGEGQAEHSRHDMYGIVWPIEYTWQ